MDCGANDLRFTPVESLLGGLLIGEAAGVVLLCYGRVLGFSGIFAETVRSVPAGWRLRVLGGLALGGAFACAAVRGFPPRALDAPAAAYALAGVLVGAGTHGGCGCTSGHGVVGLARASPRSLAATCTFIVAGVAAARVALHSDGWPSVGCAPTGGFRVTPLAWPDAPGGLLAVVAAAAVAPLGAIVAARRARAAGEAAGRAGSAAIAAVDVAAGVAAGVGLSVGGMLQQAKVRGFLDVGGAWDPSLACVMGGALGVSAAAHARARAANARPLLADAFAFAPTRQFGGDAVDAQLIAGAVLFGVGWGFLGVCPGPAFVGLALPLVARDAAGPGALGFPVFVIAMAVGTLVADLVKREEDGAAKASPKVQHAELAVKAGADGS